MLSALILHLPNANAVASWNYLLSFNEETLDSYILGIADAYQGIAICTDAGVTYPQMFAMVKKHTNAHPEYWNKDAAILILKPLNDVYPCKKEATKAMLDKIEETVRYKQ